MIYTTRTGDTWANLAFRFYQDATKFRDIKNSNSGLPDEILAPGGTIPFGTKLIIDTDIASINGALQQPAMVINSRGTTSIRSQRDTILPWSNYDNWINRISSQPEPDRSYLVIGDWLLD